MTDPDSLIRANGEDIDLNRVDVGSATLNSNNELDPSQTTTTTVTVPAIVSDVSRKDLIRLEGRVDNPDLKISVPSDTDISATRDFRADRVDVRGTVYEVAEVRQVTHPFASAEKLTAICEALPGRTAIDDI